MNPHFFESRWLELVRNWGCPRYGSRPAPHACELVAQAKRASKVVAERLEHASVGITLDHYSYTYGVDQQAAKRLNTLLANNL